MPYDLDTVDELRRAIKQPPGDLKVLLYKYGEYRRIQEIRSRYVVLCKSSSGYENHIEVKEHTTGAIQVLTID